MAVSGMGVAYSLAGFTLLWSGLKNTTLQATLTAFLHGQVPTANPTGSPTIGVNNNSSSSTAGNAGTPGATGSAISDDAMKYQGQGYVWGGNASKLGDWDCSSFVSYVLGHDLGHALPGGKWGDPGFPPNSHGPTTISYLSWSGATTVGNSPSNAQAGDLCVWQTHIGIATGNGNMISALDTKDGTKVTTITGQVPGEILFVRRLK